RFGGAPVPEVRWLLVRLAWPRRALDQQVLVWSTWRHQACARACHDRKRGAGPPACERQLEYLSLLAVEDDAQPLVVLAGGERARAVGAARRGGAPDQVVAVEVVDRQSRQPAERLRAVDDAQIHRPRPVRRVQFDCAAVDVAVAEPHRVPVALYQQPRLAPAGDEAPVPLQPLAVPAGGLLNGPG